MPIVRQAAYQLFDAFEEIVSDPVQHKAVGRQQSQRTMILDRVQRPYPLIELLFRELILQASNTSFPQRVRRQDKTPLVYRSDRILPQFSSRAMSYPHARRARQAQN